MSKGGCCRDVKFFIFPVSPTQNFMFCVGWSFCPRCRIHDVEVDMGMGCDAMLSV